MISCMRAWTQRPLGSPRCGHRRPPAAVFDGIALDDARRACERARLAIERIDCAGFAPGWAVTVSAGVVERQVLDTHEHLIRRADDLLYDAKRGGRNRIAG